VKLRHCPLLHFHHPPLDGAAHPNTAHDSNCQRNGFT